MTNIEEKIINNGYKLTKARLAVLAYLNKSDKPLSTLEIASKVKGINLSSIYRSLSLFVELNIINEEYFEDEKKYCLSTEPHHHIVCRVCKKVVKVKCLHNFSDIKNFNNIEHHLILSGICNNCQKKYEK